MGDIAPPLEKKFFSFDGGKGESIKMKSIQGDDPKEARQAQRMDQALQDDIRLGLVKNQQWTKTTETAKIQVATMGKTDFQKIEQFPPEVYTTPPFPEPVEEDTCGCFNLSTIIHGGSWLESDSGNPLFTHGVPVGWTAWQGWYTNQSQIFPEEVTGWPLNPTTYPYISSLIIMIWDTDYADRGFTPAEIACNWEVRIDPSLGQIISGAWLDFNHGTEKYDITTDPYPVTGGVALTYIIAYNELFLTQMGDEDLDSAGPFYDWGWDLITPSQRTTESPIFLYCDNQFMGGIPVGSHQFYYP